MPVTFIGLHFIFMFIGLFEIIISFSLLLLMCSCSRLPQAGKVGEWEKGPPARPSHPAGAGQCTGAQHAHVPLPAIAACHCCLPCLLLPAGPCVAPLQGWERPSLCRAAVLQIILHRLNPSTRLNVIYHATEGVVI